MKKSILFFLLLAISLIISCETQEEVLTETNPTTTIYNTLIADYFSNLKSTSNLSKENSKKINSLMDAIDYSSIKIYDLRTTERLLIVDLKNFNFTPNATNNKLILYLNQNKIVTAKIINFEDQGDFKQHDALILSIMNLDKSKLDYNGRVNQFNLIQSKEFSSVFKDGILIENGAAKFKNLKTPTSKTSGCIDWYWITTYSNGSQTETYNKRLM